MHRVREYVSAYEVFRKVAYPGYKGKRQFGTGSGFAAVGGGDGDAGHHYLFLVLPEL